jgi:hypothetical protein
MPGRCCIRRCGRGNRECQPRIPTGRPIRRIELPVCLQVQISLHVANGKDIPELRDHSENAGFEAAEQGASANVVGDLLVGVSDDAYEGLFRKKLRRAPVEMEIDTTLNLGIGVLEIVCESRNA